MDWKLSLAGLLIGLLVGFTGMGGGSLMTPLLVLFFGFKPSIAIGTPWAISSRRPVRMSPSER